MSEFLKYIGMIGVGDLQQVVAGIVRIVLAAVLGALIGLERGVSTDLPACAHIRWYVWHRRLL